MKKRLFCLLLCILMAVLPLCSCGSKSNSKETDSSSAIPDGKDIATAICMKSEHYKITGDMYSYFFYKDFYDAMDQYYSTYYSGYNLDLTKDLKEQEYTDGSTWFDYFITLTYQNLANYLTFAEAAYDDGTELGEDEKQSIEDNLADLADAAQEMGQTTEDYIHYLFGDAVTENCIRSCLELEELANLQYNNISDSIEVTDDEIEDYYEENKESFLYVDYRQVQVRAEYEIDCNTDEEKYAAAKKEADYIGASSDISEYVEREIEYLKSINDPSYNLQIDQALTDEEIEAQATSVTMQYSYTTDTDFGKWAFAEGRKSGDITVLDNGAGIYTVYYLDTAPYRAENDTVDIRMVSYDPSNYDDDSDAAKAAAQKAYDAFMGTSGSGEDFAQAVSEANGYTCGSLQKNVDLGTLDTYVEPWAFSSERKSGDCEIIESNGVYYLVYFENTDMPSWEYTAYRAIQSNKLSDITSGYYDKYTIDYNLNNMNLLSGVTPYVTEAAKAASETTETSGEQTTASSETAVDSTTSAK